MAEEEEGYDRVSTVIAVFPASDHEAVFDVGKGRPLEDRIEREPVVCWVAMWIQPAPEPVDPTNPQSPRVIPTRCFEIHGYVAGQAGLWDADRMKNFIGYVRAGERDDVPQSWIRRGPPAPPA